MIEFLNSLCPREFGKLMGIATEYKYIDDMIKNFTNIKIIEEDRDGNESGYDKKTENGLRIQVKFRQTRGKTLFSQQVHFENTRRKSTLNEGAASLTGHVAYRIDEFDCVLVILCSSSVNNPIEMRDSKNWKLSCINVKDLENKDNPGFCDTKIKSDLLYNGREWNKILEKLDNEK